MLQVLNYDCFPNRGCGYDDDCGIEETCVKENFTPRGYRCLGQKFAKIKIYLSPRPLVNNATDYSISIMAQNIIEYPITITAEKSIEYQ